MTTATDNLHFKVFHHAQPTKRAPKTGYYFVVFEHQKHTTLKKEIYQCPQVFVRESAAETAAEKFIESLRENLAVPQ